MLEVKGDENPKTLEDIAKYIATKLRQGLAREMRASDVKYSVFRDIVEIIAGEYFDEIKAEDGVDYNNILGQIDDENVNWTIGKISTEKYDVFFMPQNCQGEHCIAGLRTVIRLRKSLDEITFWDLNDLVNVIKAVYML